MDGRLSVTLRFYVDENREEALLNTYNKLYSNEDLIPTVVASWILKPIEVDDVPILVLGLYIEQAHIKFVQFHHVWTFIDNKFSIDLYSKLRGV
jgi:multidrug efflux pump subunit AcrB